MTAPGGSGRVLEIGSGGGRDALELEKHGTASGAPTFRRVSSNCLASFEADQLDPLTEDLADPDDLMRRFGFIS
ncbi:hypothetical protein NMG46_15975 [Mesorhizobium sp. LMG 17147]|nr:hypothetical protein [Mesorhizobium sp. LMG 17147]MCP9231738.1 hypothetical protein [Mesorhizobium sp. LMG 17147]